MHATIFHQVRMILKLYVSACLAAQAPVAFFALQGMLVTCHSIVLAVLQHNIYYYLINIR